MCCHKKQKIATNLFVLKGSIIFCPTIIDCTPISKDDVVACALNMTNDTDSCEKPFISYHFVREVILCGESGDIDYTHDDPIDMMTKILSVTKFDNRLKLIDTRC